MSAKREDLEIPYFQFFFSWYSFIVVVVGPSLLIYSFLSHSVRFVFFHLGIYLLEDIQHL